MTPAEVDSPDDSLLKKLSDRLVYITAIFLVVVGIGGTVAVTELIHDDVPAAIVRSLSEAFMVTGATTLIVSFALSDTVRLEPVIQRVFRRQESKIPSASEISEHVAASVNQQLDGAVGPLKKLASAYVLNRDDIYSHSITMLREMHEGEIRILMTAEEDLSTEPGEPGDSGEQWVKSLNRWLEEDFDGRRLYRVIARRPDSPTDMEQVKTQLLAPFEGRNANQWVYPDPEFALSVMLLGTRRVVFGFLPRAGARQRSGRKAQSRFEYAVVLSNELLVRNLATWFDERYTNDGKDCVATKVMSSGEIDEGRVSSLTEAS